MPRSSLVDSILGRPLASEEEDQQRLGVLAGIPVFGLDALSSAAYGSEAALTVLLPLAAAGAVFISRFSCSRINALSCTGEKVPSTHGAACGVP